MALTLSRVMERAWRAIGHTTDIKATGGSTTTIVDANTRYTSDDALLYGTAIVTYDAGGAGAAPEGEYGMITDFNATTKTFTIDTTLGAAVASGDKVSLCRSAIPLQTMIACVNDGLRDLGFIDLVDTSITYDSGTITYAIPVTAKYDQIDFLVRDDTDEMYRSIKGQTKIRPSAPGSTMAVDIWGVADATNIILVYKGVHPMLTAYSSVVSETIPEALAVAATVDKALEWLVSKRGDSALNTFIVQRWNDAKNTIVNTKVMSPKNDVKKKPKYAVFGDTIPKKSPYESMYNPRRYP